MQVGWLRGLARVCAPRSESGGGWEEPRVAGAERMMGAGDPSAGPSL